MRSALSWDRKTNKQRIHLCVPVAASTSAALTAAQKPTQPNLLSRLLTFWFMVNNRDVTPRETTTTKIHNFNERPRTYNKDSLRCQFLYLYEALFKEIVIHSPQRNQNSGWSKKANYREFSAQTTQINKFCLFAFILLINRSIFPTIKMQWVCSRFVKYFMDCKLQYFYLLSKEWFNYSLAPPMCT